MQSIIFDRKNILKWFNEGAESIIYVYNDSGKIVLLKKFRDVIDLKIRKIEVTDDFLNNKRNKIEIIKDNELFKDEVYIDKIVFDENNKFIGYTMNYEELKNARDVSYKKKVKHLHSLKERLLKYNENNIYISDFSIENVLTNINEDIIKLCDLDNIKIGDYDFDVKSAHQLDYERSKNDLQYSDIYCFNMFTIAYLYNIHIAYIRDYLTNRSIPFRLRTKENEEIIRKLYYLKPNYSEKEFIIDHMRF